MTPPLLRSALSAACGLLFVLVPAQAATPKWTILVYGHGDHNLSPSLVEDFLEMQKAGSSDDFRIVVQTDFDRSNERTYEYGLPREFGGGMTRWLVTKSDAKEVVSEVLERGPELDSDRGENLTAFIRWGLQKYPADRYALVLWDHGGSWKGFGADQQDGTVARPEVMGLNEITAALRTGMAGLLDRFDFLTFDACLMTNQEAFAQFAPFCKMYIANAEIDYGPGWDYDAALGWLKARPEATMEQFAKAEARTYRAHHTAEVDKFFMAHIALDTSSANAFVSAARIFSTQLRRHFSERVARAQRRAPTYFVGGFQSGAVDINHSAYIDLPRMANVVARDRLVPRSLRAAGRKLESAFLRMRQADALGVQKQRAGGMNIFLPMSEVKESDLNRFAGLQAEATFQWSRVIRAAVRAGRSHRYTPQLAKPADITATAGKPVRIDLSVRKGKPYAISGQLLDRNGVYSLGEAGRVLVNGERRDCNIVWDARVFQILTPDGYRILPASQQQETPLWIVEVEFSDSEKLGEEISVGTIVIAYEGGAPRIVEATGGPTSLAPRGFEPRPGTVITPRREKNGVGERGPWSFVVPAGGLSALSLRVLPLPPGTYTLAFGGEDAFGRFGNTVTQRIRLK